MPADVHRVRLKIPVRTSLDSIPASGPSDTIFQVFVGKGTAFEDPEVNGSQDILAKTALPVLVAESGRAVPWTKPEDIEYDSTKQLPPMGGFVPGYFHVLMANGAIFTLFHGRYVDAYVVGCGLRVSSGDGPLLIEPSRLKRIGDRLKECPPP